MISYAHALQNDGTRPPDNIVVQAYGVSRCGRNHDCNEDHYLLADLEKSALVTESNVSTGRVPTFSDVHSQLFLVADGMSGVGGGARASELAAATMLRQLAGAAPASLPVPPRPVAGLERQMRRAFDACQQRIDRESERDERLGAMGTTLTAAQLLWPDLCIGHVGDSRCYLMRGGELAQLTSDHVVETRRRHARDEDRLWNALSPILQPRPQVLTVRLRPGDTVLLCTDGVSREVPAARIREALLAAQSPREAAEWLVEAGSSAGGDDVTAVVARVQPFALPEPDHLEAAESGSAEVAGSFDAPDRFEAFEDR